MANQPRVYLFHGTDSRASSIALQRWGTLFQEKYGSTTRYVLAADELGAEQLVKSLEEIIGSTSLFPEPKLVLIKRVTQGERGATAPNSKALVRFLDAHIKKLTADITIAVWEEKQLAETAALMTWFVKHAELKQAGISLFTVTQWREVGQVAQKYLAGLGFSLSSEAERWLVQRYQEHEKQARLAKRLKSTDLLLEDERSWWLYQLLDSALLRASSNQIQKVDIEAGAADLVEGVSVFEIVNAITENSWKRARHLLRLWETAITDDSNYFGLYALLRMHYSRRNQQYELRLMAEVEMIIKNFTLPHAWILDQLIGRLEGRSRNKEELSLLPHRTLWLAQVHRS